MADSPWEAGRDDWAEVMEGWNGWGVPVYRQVLQHLEVDRAPTLLDVGCGAGRFCRIAADRGANVSGLDATETFVEIAQERVLRGDFRVGDMEELPWPDDSFDVGHRVQLVLHRRATWSALCERPPAWRGRADGSR